MNYYNDFMEIKESNYINPKHFECLGSNDIPNKISNIKADFDKMLKKEPDFVVNFLKVMNELAIYKQCLEIKMRTNKLKDPKEPTRKYVQIRGSVRLSKNKRIWVGVYIGTEAEVCDADGNVFPEKFCEGRESVIKKIAERFKDIYLE